MAQNRIYAGINVVGLAVGFAVAIFVALYLRNEFSFDQFIPNADKTFLISVEPSGQEKDSGFAITPPDLVAYLSSMPGVIGARTAEDQGVVTAPNAQAHTENFAYADPNFFSAVALPSLYGHLAHALDAPDSAVITARTARKYFGTDNPIGRTFDITLLSDPKGIHTFKVTAVLRDLPIETSWNDEIIISGKSTFSAFNYVAGRPCAKCFGVGTTRTYVRVASGTNPKAVEANLSQYGAADAGFRFRLVALRDIHLKTLLHSPGRPPADRLTLLALASFGAFSLLISTLNFVNLMTARASRRLTELGVRKVWGAGRSEIAAQFLGEAGLYTAISLVVALALIEQFINPLNELLGRHIRFHGLRDWWLVAGLFVTWAAISASAAVYPVMILSSHRPSSILKGGLGEGRFWEWLRQGVVAVQFALLIGLMFATLIIYRQTTYAVERGTHFATRDILLAWSCNPSFRKAVSELPEVAGTACSSWSALSDEGKVMGEASVSSDHGQLPLAFVDFDFFRIYGLRPLAGRFFTSTVASDRGTWSEEADGEAHYHLRSVVINDSALKVLGFSSPTAAIGQYVTAADMGFQGSYRVRIIGVVSDFAVESVRTAPTPAVFGVMPYPMELLSIKLRSANVATASRNVRHLWRRYLDKPSWPYSLGGYVRSQFDGMYQLSILMAAIAAIAMFTACLGLYGLSSLFVERRAKEIGVRKAMGAGSVDLSLLLLRRFSAPLLVANLIAWPTSWLMMHGWLASFNGHVALEGWVFLVCGAVASLIAILTVGLHGYLISGERPNRSLRHE